MNVLTIIHHRFALWTAPDWFSERLRQDFPAHHFVQHTDYEKAAADLPDIEVFIGYSLRPEQFAVAKKLRWIHSTAVAVHQLLFPELVKSDVVVTNSRDVQGPIVAEHALALMLALAKRLPSAARHQQQRHWGQSDIWNQLPHPRQVQGTTTCIIGLGGIGSEFARRVRSLGITLIAVREHADRKDEASQLVDRVFSAEQLHDALRLSDYIVLAAPLTPRTERMIDAAALAAMKRDAYLINVSRGALIDEPALIAALGEHRLGGAALDVFEQEPLPPESPLWQLDNVFITPHTAAVSDQLWERHYALFADNFRRYLAHQPLRNIVDKRKGY